MYFLTVLEPHIFEKMNLKSLKNLEYFMNLRIDDTSKYHAQLFVMMSMDSGLDIPLDFALLKHRLRLTRRIKILEILKSEIFAVVDKNGKNKTGEYLRKKLSTEFKYLSTEFSEFKKNDPKFSYIYILNIINNKYYNKYNIFEGGVGETLTPKESSNNNNPQRNVKNSAVVEEIFDYWVEVMGKVKSRTVLTESRKRKILGALKNYSVEDLKSAILGCSLSPFHMGENEQSKRFDNLSLIFRDADKIEKFMEFAVNPPAKAQEPKQKYETVEEHNKRVSQAFLEKYKNSTAIEGIFDEGRASDRISGCFE